MQRPHDVGLAETCFDFAVLQGIDFTRVNLEKSKFYKVNFGIKVGWQVFLLFATLLLASLAGCFLAAGSLLATGLLTKSSLPYGVSVLLSLSLTLFSSIRKNFVLGTIIGIGALLPLLLLSITQPSPTNSLDISVPFFLGSGAIVLVSISIEIATLSLILLRVSLASIVIATVSTFFPMLGVTIISVPITKVMPIVIVTIAISWHLSRKALTCSPGGLWRLQAVIAIVTRGGNSFKGAKLTDVDFTAATLKFCDFREANLTRTRFYEVKALNYARLDNTYLANPQIRQLVVTLNGQSQNFDGLNLEGVNLQGAKLQNASFIGTNLNSANLRDANLSRAILKQAQLDGTDMTGATLTGACMEDWGITGSTKLEDVQCDYVFMRLETKDNPNRLRKPDNWGETFALGEFADFIKPYVNTLDLYHSQDIDPRAISIALKNLSTNHPEQELRFVAIERRGNNGLNLRFTTAPGADKSELSHQYFRDYARIKKELPVAVQLRLAERDAEIRTLKDTIEQFIQTGTHQSKIQAETIQIVQGELIVTQNKGINIRSGGGNIGDITGLVGGDVSGVVNLGTISGNVTNMIARLPESEEPSEPNIKELLTQLQQAIENDSDLSDPDKADLLEQVQALAEAKQTEEPAKKEGLTRKARKMFEATLSSLPQTASIVEACTKLLSMIMKGLGLPA